MSKYLLEIKNRVILLIITWFSTILVSYLYKEVLLFIVIQSNTFLGISESLVLFYFIFTDVTEVLAVYLRLIAFSSSQVLFIYSVYHFFLFISPSLFHGDYLYCKLSIKIAVLMWSVSAVLSTCFFIPFTWSFFLSFQDLTSIYSFHLHFEAKLKEYLYFYISFYFLCGFYFQVFALLLLFLNYIDVNATVIKKFRKLYYYFFVILSALISPPEIFSQILISTIAIFIYEFLLLFFLLKTYFKFTN